MHIPQFKTTLAVPVIAALLFAAPGCQAMPTAFFPMASSVKSLLPSSLEARAIDGMSPAMPYLNMKEVSTDRNAYDPGVKNKCALYMRTEDGGNCLTAINCIGTKRDYTPMGAWNVCYLNGRQFFTHPDIGNFSIQYTKAGGIDGNTEDGLHHPVLRFANFNDWEEVDVQALIDKSKGEHGNVCTKSRTSRGRGIVYDCGIPKLGNAAFGLSIHKPVDPSPGFTPGWCSMHVVQYQRNRFGIGVDYAFDVILYDAAKKKVGLVQRKPIDANTKSLTVTSYLPWQIEIEAKGGDADPVVFKYSGQTWKSGDGTHRNTLGDGHAHGYEYGNRKGDMEFAC